MIQLTRYGTVFSGSAADLECICTQFDRQHCIRLPQLLEPGLLQFIQREIDQAEFHRQVHKGIAVEFTMTDNIASDLLHFLTNDLKLFQIIQQITRCARIGCFNGRVYSMVPGCGHYDSWHGDISAERLIGMSINLSPDVYSGGIFQIRDRESGHMFYQVANTGFGDGIVFRLGQNLQHCINDVIGTVPKTAFAGWFQSCPDFHALLRKSCSEPR